MSVRGGQGSAHPLDILLWDELHVIWDQLLCPQLPIRLFCRQSNSFIHKNVYASSYIEVAIDVLCLNQLLDSPELGCLKLSNFERCFFSMQLDVASNIRIRRRFYMASWFALAPSG